MKTFFIISFAVGICLLLLGAVLFLVGSRLCDIKTIGFDTIRKIDNVSFLFAKLGVVILMLSSVSLVFVGLFSLL